nr:glutamate mutase L [Chloroflexota bacterium]
METLTSVFAQTTPGIAPYTLVCDYGSVWTKATLFGKAAGASRLIATRSIPTPTTDGLAPDLVAATVQVERAMQEQTGVPNFGLSEGDLYNLRASLVPVGSSAPPMKVVLVCADSRAVRRVAEQLREASYIKEIHAGSVAELLNHGTLPGAYRPDVVLLLEGNVPLPQSQQLPLAQLLARVGADTRLVPVLHCVPEGVDSGAAAMLGRMDTEVVHCDLLARPPHGLGAVQRRLHRNYSRQSLWRASGAAQLPVHPEASFTSAAACAMISARYAAGTGTGRLVLLDIGASSITACVTTGEDLSYKVLAGLGLGRGSAALYARVGENNLRRWLPFEPYSNELSGWALHRSLHPSVMPLSLREALVEQAFAREAVRLGISELALDTPPELVVGSGALARGIGTRAASLVITDALSQAQPGWQRTEIALDTANAFVAIGALAAIDPEMAGKVWERDSPRTITLLLAARGGKREEPAVRIAASWEGGLNETTVTAGHVHRVHGSWDKETSVQLTPMRDVKLEGARRKQPQTIALTPSGNNPLPELL